MNLNDSFRYLHMGVPDDIARLQGIGDFDEAIRRIDEKLAGQLPNAMRQSLTAHREILRRLPLDTLKIDRSFIIDSRREGNRVITRAMVRLGHDLGLEVVAEGVETEEHRAFADEAECDVIQGYWYSRPLPPEEVRAFLSRQGDL